MSEPKVVNLRAEPHELYIGRAPGRRGVFGNPFMMGKHGTREEVIEQYEQWLRGPEAQLVREAIRRIPPGTRLGCFCKPQACHGDVIVKIWKEMNG